MDFHKSIEKFFGNWNWQSLLVAGTAMIIIALTLDFQMSKRFQSAEIKEILHSSNAVGNEHVRWLDRNDVRSFSYVANSSAQSEIFGLGWVSASSVSIRKAPAQWRLEGRAGYEMTEVLSRALISVNDQPVSVHRYLLQGARETDIRRAIIDSASDPTIDFLLIPVSPIYYAHDHLAFTNSHQRGSFLGKPNVEAIDYKVSAKILSPLEIIMQYQVRFVGGFRYRKELKRSFKLDGMQAMLTKSGGKTSDGAGMRYWQTWLFSKDHFGANPQSLPRSIQGYRRIALMQNLDADGTGRKLFQANIRNLSNSGKPTLIYFPPLHPSVASDPSLVAFYTEMEDVMRADIKAYGGPNVKFYGDMLFGFDGTYEHLDIIHLSHGQGVIDQLLEVIKNEFDYEIRVRDNDVIYGPN